MPARERMTVLDVVPDERGKWHVFEHGRLAPLSEHASATEAELSSWSQCETLDGCVVVVHDRYRRTRPAGAWTAPAVPDAGRRDHGPRDALATARSRGRAGDRSRA